MLFISIFRILWQSTSKNCYLNGSPLASSIPTKFWYMHVPRSVQRYVHVPNMVIYLNHTKQATSRQVNTSAPNQPQIIIALPYIIKLHISSYYSHTTTSFHRPQYMLWYLYNTFNELKKTLFYKTWTKCWNF